MKHKHSYLVRGFFMASNLALGWVFPCVTHWAQRHLDEQKP